MASFLYILCKIQDQITMKIITILLSVIALNSCGNTKAASNMQENLDAKKTETLSGKYIISNLINTEELPEDIHLIFDETTNKVSGYAGCNTFSGNYTIEGNKIKLDSFIATRMYCEDTMEIEQNLMNALQEADSFSLENMELSIKNENGILLTGKKNTTSKISQKEDLLIEYKAISRGLFQSVTIKGNTILVQKDRSSEPQVRKCTNEEIASIEKLLAEITLKELENLEAPTKAHQYDGAAGATLKITKKGDVFRTVTFDHGNPNKKIAKFVNSILKMAELQ